MKKKRKKRRHKAVSGGGRALNPLHPEVIKAAETATRVAIAKAFCKELALDLTPEQLELARERNRTETATGVCHTHDFCDSNMTMLAAFVACGLVKDLDSVIEESMHPLWNSAWDLALKAEFHADRISSDRSVIAS
ncbi:hypothetical protein [Cupriavidus sp. AcVe19-6a]|uniref:hypothetical protein n=1 Tax=Cupriavidus sp. AcVe19-6a TaxID=2821358 RepID=UPI001AEA808B|nr:hypothetical protein [Cupriavidus sp. AcVe19-6a]MBP0639946.1 hypothetical protein [Cupriavidus sp. AcVe19-6a]